MTISDMNGYYIWWKDRFTALNPVFKELDVWACYYDRMNSLSLTHKDWRVQLLRCKRLRSKEDVHCTPCNAQPCCTASKNQHRHTMMFFNLHRSCCIPASLNRSDLLKPSMLLPLPLLLPLAKVKYFPDHPAVKDVVLLPVNPPCRSVNIKILLLPCHFGTIMDHPWPTNPYFNPTNPSLQAVHHLKFQCSQFCCKCHRSGLARPNPRRSVLATYRCAVTGKVSLIASSSSSSSSS